MKMPRRCSICTHPQAHAINTALLGGASIRDVSGRFGVSRTATGSHALNHLPARVAEGASALTCGATTTPSATPETVELARYVQERANARTAEVVNLRDRLRDDLGRLDRLYALALANGNLAAATRAIHTRWAILARAGVLANIDAAPEEAPGRDPAQAGAEALRALIGGFMKDVAKAKARGAKTDPEEEPEDADAEG